MAESVLIVEPDLTVRHPIAEYLRECGYRVIEAVSSDEAVSVLHDGRQQISIVLADVDCPGKLNGFELSKWIREGGLASKVLLAGSLERLAETAGDLCKDAPTIRTPYSHHELLREIKSTIAHRERTVEASSKTKMLSREVTSDLR